MMEGQHTPMTIPVALPYPAPNPEILAELQKETELAEKICVVGALVVNDHGKIFVHKRSAKRKFLPGCWDIPGGHVEAGESLLGALERELLEETGWQLQDAVELLCIRDWQLDDGSRSQGRREFDFLVTTRAPRKAPRLEHGKHVDHRWVGRADLPLLMENRSPGDSFMQDLVRSALERLDQL